MKNKKNRASINTSRGFTLIEISLTVALIVLLAGFSLPLIREFIIKNDLETATIVVAHNLRRAQTLAMGAKYDSRWGVAIESGVVTIYAFDGAGTRISEYDEAYTIPTNVNLSGITDVQFNKFNGEPINPGIITISNLNNDETETITINEKGLVSF